jgi:hypothetical protein
MKEAAFIIAPTSFKFLYHNSHWNEKDDLKIQYEIVDICLAIFSYSE